DRMIGPAHANLINAYRSINYPILRQRGEKTRLVAGQLPHSASSLTIGTIAEIGMPSTGRNPFFRADCLHKAFAHRPRMSCNFEGDAHRERRSAAACLPRPCA